MKTSAMGFAMKKLLGSWVFLLTLIGLASGQQTDPKDWTPVRIRGEQKAPEFADIDTWLHSEPLTMAKLKGKVVVIHFMAVG
jgi:hypothetical protein